MNIPTAPNINWPSLSNTSLLSFHLKSNNPIIFAESGFFTEKAKKVFYELVESGYSIYHAEEKLSHDGFDLYGPKTVIRYLHVFTYGSSCEPIQMVFNWENWFIQSSIDTNSDYELTDILTLNTSNDEFKSILEMM
jgi:hypothetical protein